MSFNPGASTLFGVQWPVTREGVDKVDSDVNVAAALFTSSAAETIDQLGWYLTQVQDAATSKWEVEIYDATLLDSGAAGTSVYRPDTDAVTNQIRDEAGTTTTLFTSIDESSLNLSDYITTVFGAPFLTLYRARFASIAGTLTGRVITGVTLSAWMQVYAGGLGTPTLTLRPAMEIDGAVFFKDSVSITDQLVLVETTWDVNPSTGVSWKISDVEKFDTDADSSVGYYFDGTGSVNYQHRVFQMYLTVEWGTTERRLAVGTLSSPVVGRNSVTLATPTGTDNWSKAAASTRYLALLRRKSGVGSVSARWLDSGETCPHAGHGSALVGFLADGRIDPDDVDLTLTKAHTLTLLTSAAAVSADTQPYASANGDAGSGEGIASATYTKINSTQSLQQEFTSTAAAAYRPVAVLLRSAQSDPPSANLSIEIRRRSDNVRLGSELIIEPGDLVAPINGWQVVRKNLDPTSATLANGVQYYFDIQSTAPAATGWEVQVLSGVVASTYDSATFGGTTDQLTVNSSDKAFADAVLTIGQVVTVPTNFAAALQNRTLTSPNGGTCSLRTLRECRLSWTATVLGASFGYYEIQRRNQAGVWQTIGLITTEATAAMVDQELPAERQSVYRMRVVRADNSASDWTAWAYAFPEWVGGPGLLFVTNEDLTLAVGYVTEGPPERQYEFLNAETIEVHRMHGRDYQVAFRDLEERGMRFGVRAIVNGQSVPINPGEPVFTGLRTIADAPVSYVAVKDRDGNVWYASVAVAGGERIEPGQMYNADVSVLQVTATPSPVDA